MAISTLTNIPSLTAQRHINHTETSYQKAMERLASGSRINRAGDDAAGLAVSNSLVARIRSIGQATRNAQDGYSMLQVAGGGMNEIAGLLIRMRELAMQAATDTVSDRERELIEVENAELKAEIDRIAETTKYLGTTLLNGEGDDYQFQIGPDNDTADTLFYAADGVDVRAGALGVDGVDLTDRDSALSALEDIDEGIARVHVPIAQIGAMQSRMETTIRHLENLGENMSAANSRIKDADFAKESADAVKGQIQQRAGIAVLAQANQLPALALQLLNT